MEFEPMSPEEMQRAMQFLLTQQAQFAVDLEKLSTGLERVTTNLEGLTERTSTIADAVIGVTGIVTRLAERQEQTDQQIREMRDRLTERTSTIADAVIGLTGIMARLAERQERTDQQIREMRAGTGELGTHIGRVESHLDVLIDTFERHLREDHGQKPS